MHFLVFDFETTGLNPHEHECIEIGAVLLNDKLEVVGEYGSLIRPNPSAVIEPEAMRVNRIALSELDGAPESFEVLKGVADLVESVTDDVVLAGWNVWFDAAFLRALYQRSGKPWPFGHRMIDVQSIAAFFCDLRPMSQADVIRQITGQVQTHRALEDARHTVSILRHYYQLRTSARRVN